MNKIKLKKKKKKKNVIFELSENGCCMRVKFAT